MKHYGVSKEEAIEGYKSLMEPAWKDLNEAWMRPWPVAKQYFSIAFNYARAGDVVYKEDDGYSRPENTLKHLITQALIDPIPLQDQSDA
ncbi:Terpenoid synthase [Corchorus olitorius]|uniref:Terpenoid synthase n=1 Tax=Corchorus olitorius TaxID=93759 RepID=A0A1R3IZM0_9ROSI|nr:Terpenoid synthase [Corchorus olitorius]